MWTPVYHFYGLAVKTGSIALQKFILFCLFLFYFFFFICLRKTVCFVGSKYLFANLFQKTNVTHYPSYFYILTSFGVKNISALFREID